MSPSKRSAKPTSEQALSRFATRAQRAIGLPGEVNICITSSRETQALNHRFRHKKAATDVLSFPSEAPGIAGDIAISLEIAASHASIFGHSLAEEVKILILHGLLHLAGHDHETDNGEMLAREAKLRLKLGLPAGLIERTSSAMKRSSRKGSA